MNTNRCGVYTALVTPFQNTHIDYDGLLTLLTRQIHAKVRCITLFGTTGEGSTITLEERRHVLRFARSHIPSSVLLFSGCGTSSTHESILQAKLAQEEGCDGLQIAPPPYNKPSQEGIFSHYKAIHDAVQNIEIFLYNIPVRTCCTIELATIKKLIELDRVTGIKEATANIVGLMDIIELINHSSRRQHITVLTGDDILSFPSIALGAQGVMSVASNIIPKTMVQLINSCLFGDTILAQTLHYQLKAFFQACFFETNPIPVKYMLACLGYIQNEVRLPLVVASVDTMKKLDHILRDDRQFACIVAEEIRYAQSQLVATQ